MVQFLRKAFDGHSLITPEAMADEIYDGRNSSFSESLQEAKLEATLILTMALQQSEEHAPAKNVIQHTAGRLHQLREKYHTSVWRELIPFIQAHPVAEYFLQDPFTNWSHEKPRGYSGDAQLLDFIYGHPNIEHKLTAANATGLDLYEYTKNASSSVAVRERRDILTQYVDQIASDRNGEAEILTIAAGHLREANASEALKNKQIKRWIALDQDPLSIGSIRRDFDGTVIDAVDGSVRGILARPMQFGQFDFVYAAGLYDYLINKVSIKLTQRCLEMLKPGGSYLFANFAEEIVVDGYMETFMNWALLLRTESDMWHIINESADKGLFDAKVFYGENRNIVYGVITRRK